MPAMNPASGETPRPAAVGRAVAGVHRAIARLTNLLGDEDPAIIEAAAVALIGLGASNAVEALAKALPRATGARHREVIVFLLVGLAGQAPASAMRALRLALEGETDPRIALAIRKGLFTLMSDLVTPRPPSGREPSPGAGV